jgi:uncharacterized membrane protein YoaK (UPF0700 family)
MSEVAPARERPVPRWVPASLAFVAGYLDIYTFLALFGLFVANVTGSFITAGAELVTHDVGIVGKAIAVLSFIVAAALTAGLIVVARERSGAPLPWMLAFEALLLAMFAALLLAGPKVRASGDVQVMVAGCLAAAAMGTQSVIVRLLLKGIPQTNVMTGNMTQLGIDTTELLVAWRRQVRAPHDPQHRRALAAARSRLLTVTAIAAGFLLGAVSGAASYARTGLAGTLVAVVIVSVLTIWALARERAA